MNSMVFDADSALLHSGQWGRIAPILVPAWASATLVALERGIRRRFGACLLQGPVQWLLRRKVSSRVTPFAVEHELFTQGA
uniref:Uncharacterized protein n=1 Tax=mine drainage metagenome TaxID=410659 RepID=E6PQ54_9ZZZZ